MEHKSLDFKEENRMNNLYSFLNIDVRRPYWLIPSLIFPFSFPCSSIITRLLFDFFLDHYLLEQILERPIDI